MLKTSIRTCQFRADQARLVRIASRVGAGLALLVSAAASNAAAYTEASSQFMSGTAGNSWSLAVTELGGAGATMNDNRSFAATGLLGQSMTIDYAGHARAQASQTSLSAFARVDLQNPTPVGSNPIYANDDGSLNPGGVPDGYGARAIATMFDSIAVTHPSVASLRFSVALDGVHAGTVQHPDEYAQTHVRTLVQLYQFTSTDVNAIFADVNRAHYNLLTQQHELDGRLTEVSFLSDHIAVTNGEATFGFSLWAEAMIEMTTFVIEGGSFMAEADFGHTLDLLALHAYDATGAEVQLTEAFGQSGTRYTVATVALPPGVVPEPSSAWLALAALALAWARRAPRPALGKVLP